MMGFYKATESGKDGALDSPHGFSRRMKLRGLLKPAAFTLVELMGSMALISVIMLMLLQITGSTQRLWLDGRAKASQFREARAAFEATTRQLSQATLNTYWDYDDPLRPTRYERQSDLHFVCGPVASMLNAGEPTPTHGVFFQAPIGMVEDPANESLSDLLNAWGYYVVYGSDLKSRPEFLQDGDRVAERVRHRLMEFRQPAERFQVFGRQLRKSNSLRADDYYTWFSGKSSSDLLVSYSRPLAENIVAMVISPRLQLPAKQDGEPDPEEYLKIAPKYFYDSREFQWNKSDKSVVERVRLTRNQLPSTLLVTMVAIEETSAARLSERGKAEDLIDPEWFQQVRDYAEDLEALEKKLIDERVNYRVFSGAVGMRNSKWSE